MKQVYIVMGSDSDLTCMSEAAKILEEFGIEYGMTILSAHRTPHRAQEYVTQAERDGAAVFIAGAGGAAHLPGVLAAYTALPVIGVPIETRALGGVDSLYSIVQMPAGIPVATVAIGGAQNAGLLALQILGVSDAGLREKVWAYKREMERKVLDKGQRLETLGYAGY